MKLFSAALLATAVSAGIKNRRAGSDPPQHGQSCSSARGKYQKGNNIWPEWQYGNNSNENFDKCIFSNLLTSGRVGRELMQRAIWFLDPKQNYNELLDPLITDWKVLTGQLPVPTNNQGKLMCDRWKPVANLDHTEGYINQCGLMCPGLDTRINDAESAKTAIKEFLNGYMLVLNDQFAERYQDASSCFYDETTKGKHVLLGHDRDGWVNQWNEVCRTEDRCKQLVINTYGTIAKFESILGEEIPNLNRQFVVDLETLHGKDEDGFYNDGFRSGIYGIDRPDGPLVQKKRENRDELFRKNNPDRFKTN